jgi:hypothetical protein
MERKKEKERERGEETKSDEAFVVVVVVIFLDIWHASLQTTNVCEERSKNFEAWISFGGHRRLMKRCAEK